MNPHTNVATGDAIREAREALGLSRLGLAYKAGVNPRTIERIEAGEVKPRPATLTVIRQALDAEADEPVAA